MERFLSKDWKEEKEVTNEMSRERTFQAKGTASAKVLR